MRKDSGGFVLMLVSLLLASNCIPAIAAAQNQTLPQLPSLNWEPRSDWISVKANGATGDGKTDDTGAIQKVFDRFMPGDSIYFPPGTYRVTRTLRIKSPNKRAFYGGLVVGHGRETRLVWDGPVGGTLIQEEGMGYARWVGLELDGAGKAAIGQHHFSEHTFETVHRKLHMAYRHFTRYAVRAAPDDKFAMAETSFENCLFQDCAVGVSFTQFNDYNITFDGCEFRDCGIGIECIHGNFYVRNCHFEASRTADIVSQPEHGSTVRRSTSLGSKMFLLYGNPVGVMTLEGCTVGGWTNPDCAISISGAPVMLFDCTFTDPPPGAACAVRIASHHQRLVASQNTTPPGLPLFNPEARKRANVQIHEIPAGERSGVRLSARQQFLKSSVPVPGKVFDVKRDFGAKADGRTDDTAAIQRAINAARAQGDDALAYLPAGRYVVNQTLRVTGKNYRVGGAGMLASRLIWRGPKDGVTMAIEDADRVTIEHLDMQKKGGSDILQTGSGKRSFITYDGLFVSRPNDPPFGGGLRLKGLGENETVLIPCLAGAMHFIDSARATVLVPLSYYGAIVVEGKDRRRGGLLGIQSRFSGGNYNVVLRDNHSIVMSDYYSESSGNVFLLQGSRGDPPGRVTVQGAKLHLNPKRATHTLDAKNYAGQVFIGPDQFNGPQAGRLLVAGTRPFSLFLTADCFYHSPLALTKPSTADGYLLANLPVAFDALPPDQVQSMFADTLPAAKLQELSRPLDDLRRLGRIDLELTHRGVDL